MFIDQQLRKALSDRLYEKRKPAASHLEQLVSKAYRSGNLEVVEGVISELSRDFAYALRHPNYRSGGVIALSRIAFALSPNGLPEYLDDIIQPILACFGDADAKVRYYACESLYNIAKVAKGEILVYFNEIFDALCKLTADADTSVRHAANLLDQLIRDIVVNEYSSYIFKINKEPLKLPQATYEPEGIEGPRYQQPSERQQSFDLVRFIPLLVERIYVINPATRIFLTTWIILLNSIPDLELVTYVPDFLEGLLLFLSDSNKEVRSYTRTCLNGILGKIKMVAELQRVEQNNDDSTNVSRDKAGIYNIGQDSKVFFPAILEILLGRMDFSHEETRLVILEWVDEILDVSAEDVFNKLDSLFVILLPSLSDPQANIKSSAKKLNDKLLSMTSQSGDKNQSSVDSVSTVLALCKELLTEDETSRLSCLQWLAALHKTGKFSELSMETLQSLFVPLRDSSDKVVASTLELFGLILNDSTEDTFSLFSHQLIQLFKCSRELFESRGKFICLRLCAELTAERVFQTFASIINEEPGNDEFSSSFIQAMCNVLLMSPELHEFRRTLTQLNQTNGAQMFTTLFICWKKDSVATLSLCLLAEAYEHAYACLETLSKQNITVNILVQIDKLIHYIEGPVFTSLRLHLLNPWDYPYLYKTLYGMLMFLPQSEAFHKLRARLDSVSGIATLPNMQPKTPEKGKGDLVDWNMLLKKYKEAHGIRV